MSNTIQALSAKDRSTGTSSISASDRRKVIAFKAGGTIVAKDCVCFSTGATGADRIVTVVQADADAPQTHQGVGVALDAGSSGDIVRVVVQGYVEGANVASAVTIGELLNASSTAGRAEKYVAAANEAPFGQALEAASTNTCDVWIFGLFA